MTPIRVTSVDGVSLDAVIHRSDGVPPRGTAVLAHGLTVDMDEGGMFIHLAEALAEAGFTVLRFSYRGHGRSGGTQRGVTIAGELLDLQAIVGYITSALPEPLAIVAASFGAVSTALSLSYLVKVEQFVFWNPVLDLIRTFVAPELPCHGCRG
jgi:alpha-beta hydrolase superfamily lysophospholipase